MLVLIIKQVATPAIQPYEERRNDENHLLRDGFHYTCLMISFTLDDEQESLLHDWQKNHACKYRLEDGNRYTGTFGGAVEDNSLLPFVLI